jgi:hypothetical protein
MNFSKRRHKKGGQPVDDEDVDFRYSFAKSPELDKKLKGNRSRTRALSRTRSRSGGKRWFRKTRRRTTHRHRHH